MTRLYASAGAIVALMNDRAPRVLLLEQLRKTGERQTVAPKGRIEPGESPLIAAQREIAEEAGISDVQYVGYLGRQAYEFTDNDGSPAGKTVDWYLFRAGSDVTNVRREEGFTEAQWLKFTEARVAATHGRFVEFVDRAESVLQWATDRGVAVSAALSDGLFRLARTAALLVEPPAAVALCGSASRGDFVQGWSDIDVIAIGMDPDTAPSSELRTAVARLGNAVGTHASLHFVAPDGTDAEGHGQLYDMKLRAVLSRIGVDVMVVAGRADRVKLHLRPADDLADDLQLLRQFAVDRLQDPTNGKDDERDRLRRVMSVFCSGVRQVALSINPDAPLRVPTLSATLSLSDTDAVSELLREYDALRAQGTPSLQQMRAVAERVPTALDDLTARVREDTPFRTK